MLFKKRRVRERVLPPFRMYEVLLTYRSKIYIWWVVHHILNNIYIYMGEGVFSSRDHQIVDWTAYLLSRQCTIRIIP